MLTLSVPLVAKLLGALKSLLKVGLAFTTIVLAGLYYFQNNLIYPASLNDARKRSTTPEQYGLNDYELVNLETEDGVTLQCFSLKQDATSANYSNKTVLILSPNAGNIGDALPIVSIFFKEFGYNVFIYSYRGYGKSTGNPSEVGLKIDARTVMNYLDTDQQYSRSALVLYGRSLGGAVAIYIASTMSKNVSGIILENTFLSIRQTVPHIFPWLKYFTMFVHQQWNSFELVPLIPEGIPALLFSSTNDEIVPPEHMKEIFDLLPSKHKMMYSFEGAGHNDAIVQPGYWQKVQGFIDRKVSTAGY